MTKEFDVMAVGDVFTDLVMTGFAAWPQPGEEALAKHLHRDIGGGAAITACGTARLGLRTALCAAVGADADGWWLARLRGCGVDERLMRRHEHETTALTVSVSTAQERAFFTYPGANRALPDLLREPSIQAALTAARHVHIASALDHELLLALTNLLHDAQCTVSLDVGWMPEWLTQQRSLAALRAIDFFLPNEREAALLTGAADYAKMLRAFADAGLRCVVLKLGAAGAALLSDGAIHFAPSLEVAAVDTTGAGDCFDAGFIAARLNDKSPTECLRLGNLCGALSTRAPGGIAAFPTADELAKNQ